MSIGDCPHWPNCGHKSMGQCDAYGPNDERSPTIHAEQQEIRRQLNVKLMAQVKAVEDLPADYKALTVGDTIAEGDEALTFANPECTEINWVKLSGYMIGRVIDIGHVPVRRKKSLLSERVRPNVEAAPWVIEEIKKLEEQLALSK